MNSTTNGAGRMSRREDAVLGNFAVSLSFSSPQSVHDEGNDDDGAQQAEDRRRCQAMVDDAIHHSFNVSSG